MRPLVVDPSERYGSVVEGLVVPCSAGSTTGLRLCAGILCAVVVRFRCAVLPYARSQIVQAERAHVAGGRALQSRIAVMLSQIQLHFLFNALNTHRVPVRGGSAGRGARHQRFRALSGGDMDSPMGGRRWCLSETSSRHLVPTTRGHRAAEVPVHQGGVRRARGRFSRAVVMRSRWWERHQAMALPGGLRGGREGLPWREAAVVRVTDNGPGFDRRGLIARSG